MQYFYCVHSDDAYELWVLGTLSYVYQVRSGEHEYYVDGKQVTEAEFTSEAFVPVLAYKNMVTTIELAKMATNKKDLIRHLGQAIGYLESIDCEYLNRQYIDLYRAYAEMHRFGARMRPLRVNLDTL